MSDLIAQIKSGGIQLKQTKRFAVGGTYFVKNTPVQDTPIPRKEKKKPDNAVQEMKSILAGMKKTRGRVKPSAISQIKQEEKMQEEEEQEQEEPPPTSPRKRSSKKERKRRTSSPLRERADDTEERGSHSRYHSERNGNMVDEDENQDNTDETEKFSKEESPETDEFKKEDCIASVTLTLGGGDMEDDDDEDGDLPDFDVSEGDYDVNDLMGDEENSQNSTREVSPDTRQEDDSNDDENNRSQAGGGRAISSANIVLSNNSGC